MGAYLLSHSDLLPDMSVILLARRAFTQDALFTSLPHVATCHNMKGLQPQRVSTYSERSLFSLFSSQYAAKWLVCAPRPDNEPYLFAVRSDRNLSKSAGTHDMPS